MIIAIVTIFILGYLAITLEHGININKAASALVTGALCWTVYIMLADNKDVVAHQLTEHLGEISEILFFLLGAMTIVELIDIHDGFNIISNKIQQTNKRKLLWIISFITFFLSPIIDNLTTTIVMVSLIRKLIDDHEDRLLFTGIIVVASNAGGAWSPIGDVTTTMLWIGGQITASNIIIKLFLPSLICLIIPLVIVSIKMKGTVSKPIQHENHNLPELSVRQQYIVLGTGLLILLLVPVFKTITHLPPYMGIIIGLGLLWIITEIMHGGKGEKEKGILSVTHALRKIDSPSILFFLGILLAVAALQSTGVLTSAAEQMSAAIPNENIIILSTGLLSAIVDNVPLVAGVQGMYDLNQYP
ncbi:MAG TPA: sodium:proton antiporter NhaD, partial [Chitinophagaceae bacterium]|nr:sodium:proton antiporter NhaD [Chitinophagaceae bacterium]